MAFRLIITSELGSAAAILGPLKERLGDLRPVLRAFGVHMVRSVQKNFEAGGRPTPWIPSGRVTAGSGPNPRRRRKRTLKTLVDTAQLKNSITYRVVGDTTLLIGTNVKYGAVHQFGFQGGVQVREHTRRVTQVFGRRLGEAVIARVRAHTAEMRMPARPYLVIQDEDREVLRGFVRRRIEGQG